MWSFSETEKKIKSHDTQLAKKSNYFPKKYTETDYYLYVTYYNSERKLYISNDLINLRKIGSINLPELWDISVMFKDGYFYIIGDIREENYNDWSTTAGVYDGGGNRIPIYKTNDFINYEKNYVSIPLKYKQTWAPDWFIDTDGSIKIILTLSDCTETSTLTSNGSVRWKKYTYLINCNSNLTMFDEPIKIDLIDDGASGTDKIDPFLIKANGYYYIFIKQRNDQYIQQYKSTSLTSGYKLINEIKVLDGTEQGFEAPYCIEKDGNYYLGFQSTNQTKRTNYVCVSNNIEKFSYKSIVENNDKSILMHFTPCKISNVTAKNIISQIIKTKGVDVKNDNDYNITNNSNYVLKNDSNGYILVKTFDNFIEINIDIINTNGFSQFETIGVLPFYLANTKHSLIPARINANLESTPSKMAFIFINRFGEIKVYTENGDSFVCKGIKGNVIFSKDVI